MGRSPHRERGLKPSPVDVTYKPDKSLPSPGAWIETGSLASEAPNIQVAPLTGSVD